jgi:hypothetical protein
MVVSWTWPGWCFRNRRYVVAFVVDSNAESASDFGSGDLDCSPAVDCRVVDQDVEDLAQDDRSLARGNMALFDDVEAPSLLGQDGVPPLFDVAEHIADRDGPGEEGACGRCPGAGQSKEFVECILESVGLLDSLPDCIFDVNARCKQRVVQ